MPIYNYKCKDCGKEFEYEQRITEDAITVCPVEVCTQTVKGKGKVYRIISKNIGVIFNGSGFYETDYARKNHDRSTVKSSYKPIADTCGSDGCACRADIVSKNETAKA